MHLEEEENYKKGPFKVPAFSCYAALVSISVPVCENLSGFSAELRKLSDAVQLVKGSLRIGSPGTPLFPQLSLSQLSILECQ